MIRWTPEIKEILRLRWADGVTIKAICFEIGCSASSLKTQRRKLCLLKRRNKWGEAGRGFLVKIRLPDEEYEMVRRGATRRRATNSQYLRSLIRRDASQAGGSVVVVRDGGQRVVSGVVQ